MTLIPWENGQALLWDFTSSDTLAPSNLMTASRNVAGVASAAQQLKHRKYASLSSSYIFYPVCIETLGVWDEFAKALIYKIGARVCENTGDPRATSFLVQRLAIDVQRGNAASVMATLPSSKSWDEMGVLPLS